MHHLAPHYNLANFTKDGLKSLSKPAITAGLLLLSTQINAAQTSYRSTEGHTHAAETMGADMHPLLGINTSTAAQKSVPGHDNHLTLTPEHVRWFGGDIWITDIGTLLYQDNDLDGYFSGFSLTIDADTDYSQADVYATIDIQRTSGDRERLHTTGRFSIYGNSLTDEFRIDIELVRNYPIANYDLFVNLLDANDHSVVDSVGATDISNLSRLPLESEELDSDPTPIDVVIPVQLQMSNDNIRVVEHAGASSAWLLLALGIPAMARRRREAKSLRKTSNNERIAARL